MVATLKTPFGQTLTETRHDLYQTQLVNNPAFYWLATNTQSVTNYFVRQVNVTLNSDDLFTVEANQVTFLQHCTSNHTSCATGKKGMLIWGNSLVFAGKQHCFTRTYTNHPCLVTPTSIRCTDINLIISSLFHQYHCGVRGPFVRLVVTTDPLSIALHNTTDFIPMSSDFSNIFNETRLNPDPKLSLIVKQFNPCSPY